MIKEPLKAGFGQSGERYAVSSFEKTGEKTYRVEFANGESEIFSPEEFIKYDLYATGETNRHSYRELYCGVNFGRCKAVAGRQAASSPKPSAAVAAYVRALGFTDETVIEVIDALKEEGALDDARVAARLAAQRTAAGKASSGMIVRELISKGIDREAAENAVGELDYSDADAAAAIAESRKSLGQDELKVMRYLAGKGFSQTVVLEAVRKVYGCDE